MAAAANSRRQLQIELVSSRVRVNTERTAGMSTSSMAALMLAVFTVSVGFGVVLPLLPYLIERLLGAGI